jgi:hypothetical protein
MISVMNERQVVKYVLIRRYVDIIIKSRQRQRSARAEYTTGQWIADGSPARADPCFDSGPQRDFIDLRRRPTSGRQNRMLLIDPGAESK